MRPGFFFKEILRNNCTKIYIFSFAKFNNKDKQKNFSQKMSYFMEILWEKYAVNFLTIYSHFKEIIAQKFIFFV